MELKDCTKEELLTIIEDLKRNLLTIGNYHLKMALLDVERTREDRAKKLTEQAAKKRMEYIELMAPYEGKKFGDIPPDVLSKAYDALLEAENLDEEWNKLMGIK